MVMVLFVLRLKKDSSRCVVENAMAIIRKLRQNGLQRDRFQLEVRAMSKMIRLFSGFVLLVLLFQITPVHAQPLRAGLRASNYGISPFPSPNWWVSSINSMASRFPGSTGEQIAVVVEVLGGGGKHKCWAHFPNPTPGTT